MKKITLLVVAMVFAVAAHAQTTISFESDEGYDTGNIDGQVDWQTEVSFIQVVDDMASDGDQSLDFGLDENGEVPEDQIVFAQKPLQTALSSGQKEVSMQVYVPSDFGANSESSQLHIIPGVISEEGVQPLVQAVIIQGQLAVVFNGDLASTGLTLNSGDWNKVSIYPNLDEATYQIGLNDELAVDENGEPIDLPAGSDSVGSLTLATDGTVEFHVDDIYMGESTMGVEDFETSNFTHYTKNNTLYMTGDSQIEEVAVYNMLGQEVATETVNNTSGELNIADLSSGIYIAKVSVNGQSKSFKFSKK